MATVIDALIVTLGLDPANYKKGAREAVGAQKKLKDDISSLEDQLAAIRRKSSKDTAEADKTQIAGIREVIRQKKKALTDTKSAEQEQTKRQKDQAEAVDKTKNAVLGLVAVLTAGAGVKAFVQDIIYGDAALGRMSANLGESAQTAAAFGAVIKSLGGDAREGLTAFSNLAAIRFAMQAKGDYSKAPVLSRLGISPEDLNDLDKALAKIAATAKTMPKALFFQYATEAGFSAGAINALELGNTELAKQIELQKERQRLTDAQIAQDQQLVSILANLTEAAKGFGRDALGVIIVAVKEFIRYLPAMIGLLAGVALALAVVNAAAIAAGIAMAAAWVSAAAPVVLLVAALATVGAAIGAVIGWLLKARSGIDFLHQSAAAFSALLHGDWAGAWKAAKQAALDALDGIKQGIHSTIEAAKDLWYALTHHGQARPGGGSAAAAGASPQAGTAPGGQQQRANFAIGYLKSRGLSDAAARGAIAGAIAESRLDPNAVNPTSGAFGIGQWLGSRKSALFGRFGSNPTFDQQLQFLADELNGGDRGGAAVTGATTAQEAMRAYVGKFMRPAAGRETSGDLSRGAAALAQLGVPGIDSGLTAGAAAGLGAYTADNSRSASVKNDVQIGKIEVHTAATDAAGIARSIGPAVKNEPLFGFAAMANSGLA